MKKILLLPFVWLALFFLGACEGVLQDIEDNKREGIEVQPESMTAYVWKISFFNEKESDSLVNSFLQFKSDKTLAVINPQGESFTGQWLLAKNNKLLVIRMDQDIDPFDELEDEWVVLTINSQELHIIEEDGNDNEEFKFIAVSESDLPNRDDDDEDDDEDDRDDDDSDDGDEDDDSDDGDDDEGDDDDSDDGDDDESDDDDSSDDDEDDSDDDGSDGGDDDESDDDDSDDGEDDDDGE